MFDLETGDALAAIETPKGSRNNHSYNQSLEVFELRKVLPRGMIFPYDFGFVPEGASQAATHHPPDAS
jgi:inorganic pyrophosphatase